MRIAYIVPVPSLFSFVYNEMIEVQDAGHELVIVPLHSGSSSPRSARIVDRLRPLKTLPASLCNSAIIWHALLTLLTRPMRVFRTLFSLHCAAGFNLFVHAGILAVTPKALAMAWWFDRLRVHRIHAHFASHTATCAGIASLVSAIPFSFTAHAYDIYCTTLSLRNVTLNWKLRHAIQAFAISEHGKNFLCSQLCATDRGHVHKVYVGIPLDLFKEQAPPPISNEIRLLCIASLDRKKGLNTLLDACALLKKRSVHFKLRIYGDGPLREELTKAIVRLALIDQVELRNPIPQEEVAKELETCHVFVMPCRKDPITGNIDGIPTVFMEAMATGRPVITCPVAGIPELVRNGETGLLVDADDPAGLAEAITRLKAEDSLRLQLGRQARALAEQQHDQRRNARQFIDLMMSVASKAVCK
jgi:colanic acid/amylovoran biosynthesis glycosyltransferase